MQGKIFQGKGGKIRMQLLAGAPQCLAAPCILPACIEIVNIPV